MGEARRAELLKLAAEHGVMIFEDECYSDLVWSGKRPPSLYAMANGEGVIYIGSFSKSIAPALRVGYIVAKWDILSRILALKQDAGTGALEQMVLAEFCSKHFADHVPKLNKLLAGKLQVLREALAEQFGTAAEFGDPPGGIYLWIKLPDNVDTVKLAQAALAAGVSLNPGPEWSTNKDLCAQPAAALLRQSRARDHQAGRRGAGRGLPPRVRRAPAQRQHRQEVRLDRVVLARRSDRGHPSPCTVSELFAEQELPSLVMASMLR